MVDRAYGGVSPGSASRGGRTVNEDQVKGKAKQAEGQAQESWGDVKEKADDTWEEAKDKLDDLGDKIDELKDKVDRDDDKSEDDARQREAGAGRPVYPWGSPSGLGNGGSEWRLVSLWCGECRATSRVTGRRAPGRCPRRTIRSPVSAFFPATAGAPGLACRPSPRVLRRRSPRRPARRWCSVLRRPCRSASRSSRRAKQSRPPSRRS